MLKPIKTTSRQAPEARFAIVASRYNARYVDSMLRAARLTLINAKAAEIQVIRVPGAFEIPAVAAALAAAGKRFSAIICLGVILRGQTTHAQHIGDAVSAALAQIQIQHHVPVVHEVLLLENETQAKERCLSRGHNRGAEAATTAIEMARTMAQVRKLTAPAPRGQSRQSATALS
jgi:6,7-dimethyl-8-ribityllumazine synthase